MEGSSKTSRSTVGLNDTTDLSGAPAEAPSDGTEAHKVFVNDGQTTFVGDSAAAATYDRIIRNSSASRKRSLDETKQKTGPKKMRLESYEGPILRARPTPRVTMNFGGVGNYIEHVAGGTVTMGPGGISIRRSSDKQTKSSSSRKTPGVTKIRVINGPPSPKLKKRLASKGMHVNHIGTYVEEIAGPGNLSFDCGRPDRQFTSGARNEDSSDDTSDQ